MFLSPLTRLRRRTVLVAVAFVGAATALAASEEEAPFLAENEAAMTKMMAAMEITPSGDVDRDFVAMMVPHHQGAIDMALTELRYGRNEQLKRLAQEIIVTQQQEIATMRLAVGEPLPPSTSAPTQPFPSSPPDQPPGAAPIDVQPVSHHHAMHILQEP